MEPKVRFIVETFSSSNDTNGNSYHHSVITSTKTGKRLQIKDIGGPGNARALLQSACQVYCYPTVFNIETSVSKERVKHLNKHGWYEHDVRLDLDLVRNLELEDTY